MSLIVVIDGPLGANKSRVADIIGSTDGWHHTTLIPHSFEEDAMIARSKGRREMYMHFVDLVRSASRKLEKLRAVDRLYTVLDSYWPSVLAVHRWLGVEGAEMEDFGEILREDVLVHLTVSHTTSLTRLRRRDHPSDLIIEDPNRYKDLQRAYDDVISQYAQGTVMKINSGAHISPEDIADKILKTVLLEKLKR